MCFADIQQSGTLDILPGSRWRPRTRGLPSWIPDLHRTRTCEDVFLREEEEGYIRAEGLRRKHIYMAQDLFCAAPPRLCSGVQLVDKTVLRLGTSCIDRVGTSVGPSSLIIKGNVLYREHNRSHIWKNRVHEWMTLVGITEWPELAPGPGSVEDSFWRALTRDHVQLRSWPPFYRRAEQADYEGVRDLMGSLTGPTVPQPCHDSLIESKLTKTEEGRIGMVPDSGLEGDEIHTMPGSRYPFVLRPVATTQAAGGSGVGTYAIPAYTVVGDCYLHGCMDFDMSAGDMPEWRLVDLH